MQTYDLRYRNEAFKQRVTAAVAHVAVEVLNEAGTVPLHTRRLGWARRALQDTPAMAERVLWSVLGSTAVQASGADASDADLKAAVAAAVNVFINETAEG